MYNKESEKKLICKECKGENFRGVRENHELTGYKCVRCGEVSPLKKSAFKKRAEIQENSEV